MKGSNPRDLTVRYPGDGEQIGRGWPLLERVEFPASVRVIGGHAFASCPKLREAHLPSGLKRIESCAFAHCIALKQVEPLPSGASVAADAFYPCSNYVQGLDRQHKDFVS